LTSTLAATVLVSLRRMRAAWPIVLAAGLTCLLASSLLAAGPLYASAVSLAGLHRVLADAPVDQANIQVLSRADPDQAAAVDATVSAAIDRALEGVGGTITRIVRSDTFDLPIATTGPRPDLVELEASLDLDSHATLLSGAWPEDVPATGQGGPLPVVVAAQVAEPLGLAIGDELSLTSRLDRGLSVPVRIVGTFRIDDPSDPFWWGDPQVIDGLVTSDAYATHGPFFTTMDGLLQRATVSRSELVWRAVPIASALTLDGMGRLRTRVESLDGDLQGALGVPVTVTTSLPAILTTAERSLLVSRTGVLLLVVQLAVLAAYAVLLSAALLVEHRRVDTAMLRSRGAGPVRIAAMTLVEGVVLTLPAAVLGPWVALAGLQLFNIIGPLATIGMRIAPAVAVDAYIASAAAALACLVALLLPAIPTRRSFAAAQSGLSRAGTRPAGQRLGLDIALLAIAAIGLWQLRLYGAPLTRSVQGTVGIDPLLVATPAIGLLAGAVVALRLLPLFAVGIERVTSRGRGLVSSLGARQLARRPLRYTRAALLLMLAMAMGVFAVSYTVTWTASQRDQATFQVGADARVTPGAQTDDPPRWALDRTYAAVPGIAARMPVDRSPVSASRTAKGELVALDAAAAPAIVQVRPDLLDTSVSALMAPLAAQRPTLQAVRLPDGARSLRLQVDSDLREVQQLVEDPATGEATWQVADPSLLFDRGALAASVVVRDATGALYRFTGDRGSLGTGPLELTVPLGDPDRTGATFATPLDLVAVELGVTMPPDLQLTNAGFAVRSVAASGPDTAAELVDVPLAIPSGWRLTSSVQGAPHTAVDTLSRGAMLQADIGSEGIPILPGVDRYGRGTTLTFAPVSLGAIAGAPIPAIASRAFLDASGHEIGDTIPIEISSVRRSVALVGEVAAFPTVDAATPTLVVDLATVALARFEGSDAVDPATEWWLGIPEPGRADTVAALQAAPINSRTVLTVDARARALATDPVALGIIGALAIGFVAAALFAVVGFIVSAAVSARERVTEFALLRALGLSSGQLSSWLSLENAVLAGVSLIAGSLLGLLIAWVVLPFVTVTQAAATPYPPVDMIVPWLTIAILEVVAIVALTTTVIVLAWLLRRVGLASALRMGED
jgi:hypothetical protein